MFDLAMSDWQMAAYSGPIVLAIALLVLALLRSSEGPRTTTSKPPQLTSLSRSPAAWQSVNPTTVAKPRARPVHGQVVACPDCSRRLAVSQLNAHRREMHGTVRRCPLCNQYICADKILRHNLKQHGVHSEELLKRPSLQCPRCHNSVLRVNIGTHLQRVHGMDLRPALGWHPIVAAMQDRREKFWLIDGLNIVRLQGEDVPRFDFLLALTYHMLQQEMDFLCVLDASARPCVRELQGTYFAQVCVQLLQTYPRRFTEVPSGHTADEAILDVATMLGQKVITNDQFRDHAARYPWLEKEADRRLFTVQLRHSVRPHREVLVWRGTTITVPKPQKVRRFVQDHRRLLLEREREVTAVQVRRSRAR
jgi:hypothetical protein